MMQRRDLIMLLGAAAAWPRRSSACCTMDCAMTQFGRHFARACSLNDAYRQVGAYAGPRSKGRGTGLGGAGTGSDLPTRGGRTDTARHITRRRYAYRYPKLFWKERRPTKSVMGRAEMSCRPAVKSGPAG